VIYRRERVRGRGVAPTCAERSSGPFRGFRGVEGVIRTYLMSQALEWLNHFDSSLKRLTCIAMCPATLNLVLDLRLCGGSSDLQIKSTSNTLQTYFYIISNLHLLDYDDSTRLANQFPLELLDVS